MKTAMQQLREDIEALKYHDGEGMKNAIITRIELMFKSIERQQLEDAWSESYTECFTDTENGEDYFVSQSTHFDHYFKTTYYE